MNKFINILLLTLVGMLLLTTSAFAATYNLNSFTFIYGYYGDDTPAYKTTETQVITTLNGATVRHRNFASFFADPRSFQVTINGVTKSFEGNTTSTWAEQSLITGLTPNTGYSVTSKLYNGEGTLKQTSTVTAYTDVAAPSTPTTSDITHDKVTLTWNKGTNVNNPASYTIYKGESALGPWTPVLTTPDTTAIAQNLSVDTTYYFKVMATGINGSTANSGVTSATTSGDPVLAAVSSIKGATEAALAAVDESRAYVLSMSNQMTSIDARFTSLETAFFSLDQVPPEVSAGFAGNKSVTRNSQESLSLILHDNVSLAGNIQSSILVNGAEVAVWGVRDTYDVHLVMGYNNIKVLARNDAGNMASKMLSIWRIN